MMQTKEIEQTWLDRIGNLQSELDDGTTPAQWIEEGFSFDSAWDWRQAGAFDPERTKTLEEEGVKPEEVSRRITPNEELESGFAYSGYSIAYMYCNGDLSLENVRELVKTEIASSYPKEQS